MRSNGSPQPWALSHLPFVMAVSLFCVLLTFLLARGTAGGDEGEAIRFALRAHRDGWSSILTSPIDAILIHRLFWTIEKYALNEIFLLIIPSGLYGQPMVRDALLTLDGSLFMLLTGLVGWLHLRSKGHSSPVSSLAISAMLLASSAVSFFAGGVIECLMCLLVMLIVTALDREGPLSHASFLRVLVCGFFLIFCKEYALLFLLPLALLFYDSGQRLRFLVLMVSGSVIWFLLFLAGAGSGDSTIAFYQRLISVETFTAFGSRLVSPLFSLSFGLMWCFPLLFLVGLSWAKNRRSLLLKILGVVLVLLFLALFPFSLGTGAVAGPRYIVPFLMIFLPEVADGLSVLARRKSRLLFAIPLAALLFMPSLDYRNSLISRWVSVADGSILWPHTDLQMHPAVFAWRVIAARTSEAASIRISPDLPYIVKTTAVFPMSGLSRIIYALDSRPVGNVSSQPDPRVSRVAHWLSSHRLDNLFLWHSVRALLVLLLLAWLVHAANSLSPLIALRGLRPILNK